MLEGGEVNGRSRPVPNTSTRPAALECSYRLRKAARRPMLEGGETFEVVFVEYANSVVVLQQLPSQGYRSGFSILITGPLSRVTRCRCWDWNSSLPGGITRALLMKKNRTEMLHQLNEHQSADDKGTSLPTIMAPSLWAPSPLGTIFSISTLLSSTNTSIGTQPISTKHLIQQ